MADNAILGPIAGATITADDVDRVAAPYVKDLGYVIGQRGTVSADQAAVWGAPAHAGKPFLVMNPASGDPCFIRLVQSAPVPGYKAMTTLGWHSLEITVESCDAIPPHLARQKTQFRTVGDPHDLGVSTPSAKPIRAMQVVGLAEEVLYLTEIPTNGSKPHLPNAKSFIDRIFIVPLAAPNMDTTRDWYIRNFAEVKKGIEARNIPMKLIATAMGLGDSMRMAICTVVMPGKSLIEIDDMPPGTKARPRSKDSLPPGIATMSFKVDSLDRVKLPFIAPPRAIKEAPYDGKRVGVVVGSATELIELVEG